MQMSAVSSGSSPRNVLSSNGKKYEMYYETKYQEWKINNCFYDCFFLNFLFSLNFHHAVLSGFYFNDSYLSDDGWSTSSFFIFISYKNFRPTSGSSEPVTIKAFLLFPFLWTFKFYSLWNSGFFKSYWFVSLIDWNGINKKL